MILLFKESTYILLYYCSVNLQKKNLDLHNEAIFFIEIYFLCSVQHLRPQWIKVVIDSFLGWLCLFSELDNARQLCPMEAALWSLGKTKTTCPNYISPKPIKIFHFTLFSPSIIDQIFCRTGTTNLGIQVYRKPHCLLQNNSILTPLHSTYLKWMDFFSPDFQLNLFFLND